MTFVSYAQNFEDVMLWRALHHVANGFYVDIGAQDPIVDSVSRGFYEQGWRGLNVEPNQQYVEKLREARTDEVVLQTAIGDRSGFLDFYEFENTGLSTADEAVAQRHIEAGFAYTKKSVPVISLDALLDSVAAPEIHWLKIDVEGFEKIVLSSWKEARVLPWIVVVESTAPLTQQETHEGWEHFLTAKDYRFAYFDGLNRFYVSPHHLNLMHIFSSPPNVFDGFVLSGTASHPFYSLVESRARQAQARLNEIEAPRKALQARLAQISSQTQTSDERLEEVVLQIEAADARAAAAEEKAKRAAARLEQAKARIMEAERRIAAADTQMAELNQQSYHWKMLAEERARALETVYASRSWRITAPIRRIVHISRVVRAPAQLKAALKRRLRNIIRPVGLYFVNQPRLRQIAVGILNRYPRLKARLYPIVLGVPQVSLVRSIQQELPETAAQLTSRAVNVYLALKRAIGSRNY